AKAALTNGERIAHLAPPDAHAVVPAVAVQIAQYERFARLEGRHASTFLGRFERAAPTTQVVDETARAKPTDIEHAVAVDVTEVGTFAFEQNRLVRIDGTRHLTGFEAQAGAIARHDKPARRRQTDVDAAIAVEIGKAHVRRAQVERELRVELDLSDKPVLARARQ